MNVTLRLLLLREATRRGPIRIGPIRGDTSRVGDVTGRINELTAARSEQPADCLLTPVIYILFVPSSSAVHPAAANTVSDPESSVSQRFWRNRSIESDSLAAKGQQMEQHMLLELNEVSRLRFSSTFGPDFCNATSRLLQGFPEETLDKHSA